MVQRNIAHKKQCRPRTLQQGYAQGPVVVLGGWAVSYERATPVEPLAAVQRLSKDFSACNIITEALEASRWKQYLRLIDFCSTQL